MHSLFNYYFYFLWNSKVTWAKSPLWELVACPVHIVWCQYCVAENLSSWKDLAQEPKSIVQLQGLNREPFYWQETSAKSNMQSLPKHLYHLYSCLFMTAIFYLLHKRHFSLGQQTPPNKDHKFHPHLHLQVNQEKNNLTWFGTVQRTGGRKEGTATDHWCGSQNESYLILLVKAYKNSCVLYKICPLPPQKSQLYYTMKSLHSVNMEVVRKEKLLWDFHISELPQWH